ncbi:MAG: hypothetical protein IKS75_08830 [Clostridiales bacterium]|nr:hypothetical protein [Clostridiales bacterium]
MRKTLSVILSVSTLALAGCQSAGGTSQHGINQTTGVADVLAAATAENTTDTSTAVSESEETNIYDISSILEYGDEDVDLDLTVLSSNMIYSEVFAMVYAPEEYIGKTIKMEGMFSYVEDESTGKCYYACIVRDATQCCAQGIEFVPADEYAYPDDFPQVGEDICVAGVFDTYKEGNGQYITLRDARLLPLTSE